AELESEEPGHLDEEGSEFDDEELDVDGEASAQGTASSGRSHTRKKRCGKKAKKLRNNTPYEASDEFGAPITLGARTKDKKAVSKQDGQVFVRVGLTAGQGK